jgi:phosphatidylinositol alpha-1,6-mannosyltransferase
MRLLVFSLLFPPRIGGIETVAHELSRHLWADGVDVKVLTGEQAGVDTQDDRCGYAVHRFPMAEAATWWERVKQKPLLLSYLWREVDAFRPDALLCMHWDPCGYLAQLISVRAKARVPYFVLAHGMEVLALPRAPAARVAKWMLRRIALRGAREVYAVSVFTGECVHRVGVPRDRIKVIPNGVEWHARAEADALAALPKDDQPHRLLTISRLVPRKGHDTVLQAIPLISQRFPDLQYEVVGDGPERDRLEKLAASLGVAGQVRFHGRVTDQAKGELLSACSVFVLPCRQAGADFEGFGIALAEAMEAGLPVISTATGGIVDVIKPGQTGVLVRPDDPAELAAAVMRLWEGRGEARRLAEGARREVNERFRWTTVASRYRTAMEGAIRGGAA